MALPCFSNPLGLLTFDHDHALLTDRRFSPMTRGQCRHGSFFLVPRDDLARWQSPKCLDSLPPQTEPTSKISNVDVAEAKSLPAALVNLASAKAACRPIDTTCPSALTTPLLSFSAR
jgi:hypothetical protein